MMGPWSICFTIHALITGLSTLATASLKIQDGRALKINCGNVMTGAATAEAGRYVVSEAERERRMSQAMP